MAATDDAVLAAGVRWLATKRVTLGVIAGLGLVFAFQEVVWTVYGPRTWTYVFLASGEPSPGWVMAPFAHRDLTHLVTTAGVVLVYGSLVEARLPPDVYFAFYVTAGYASTAAQLGEYVGGGGGLGTLGASGAALALVTLFTTRTAGDRLRGTGDRTAVDSLFAATGVVIVALLLVNDFLPGVEFASGTAPFGHVGGMLTGVFYGLFLAWGQQGSDADT